MAAERDLIMLENTFVHIRGVGEVTERRIWESGIRNWRDYVRNWSMLDLGEKKRKRILANVERSLEELRAKNHRFFGRNLPTRERWRAYREFESSTVFLDIETTGLGFENCDITMIGLYDGRKARAFVRGINLDDFQFELPKHAILVTFNGTTFDLPFIEAKYPGVRFDQIHIDLRFLFKRLGLSGGLKRLERELGISRADDVKDLSGFDAVRLWREYQKGNDKALEALIKYNSEDIMNLKQLMRIAYDNLRERLLPPQSE
jgi:uncharacterized protein YprB with RNaseH-like and TPR domain